MLGVIAASSGSRQTPKIRTFWRRPAQVPSAVQNNLGIKRLLLGSAEPFLTTAPAT